MPNKKFTEKLAVLAVSAVFVLTAAVSFAEDSMPVAPVTLDTVLKEVVHTNPTISEAVKVYESTKEEIENARSGFRPTIGAEASLGQEVTDGVASNEVRRDLTASSAGVYARQNLFDGFGTTNYVDETRARVLAAAYSAADTANNIFNEATEAYLNVIKERELLKLAEENVYIQAQILDQIQEKTESGFGRASDLLNSQSRLALARANYISQQQNLKQAAVRLHKLMGRFLEPKNLVEPDMAFQFPVDVEEVVEIAFKNYPALEVAKYNIITKKYSMKRTESRYYPTLDAELRADYSNNVGGDKGDTTSYSAMLYLNYELYDGGRRGADKKKNYKDILKEHERSYIERRNLNESVRLAYNIKEAEEKKYLFLKDHVKLGSDTMEAFKDEYQLGRRTLLELLDMENEVQEAKKALAESKFAYMTAYMRLMHTTGALLYEYETDLFDTLGLEKREIELEELEKYAEMNNNKDEDKVIDFSDQCDSSLISETAPYGCDHDENIKIGYIAPDTLEPYIKPKEAESLELGGDALTLEPEPAAPMVAPKAAEKVMAAPEPEPVAAPVVVTKGSELNLMADKPEESVHFANILFAFDSAMLTNQSEEIVTDIGNQIRVMNDYSLDIIGHTDNMGSMEVNNRLSQRRADSVYNLLKRTGVPAENMTTYGKGESEPLFSNDTEDGRAKNRRIEFKFHHLQ